MEAQAERRIMNAKKRDIPRKTSMPAARPSKRPVDFSESEKEESEYETEGEEEKVEHEYEEEGHEQEEEEEMYEESEEEAEEPKQKVRESGTSLKRKGIESDEESPPRKAAAHRRMAIVYDSDEE
nr:protein LEO1 homolog [Ipomoea batatas]